MTLVRFPVKAVYDFWQEITLDRFPVKAGAQTLDPVRFPVKAGAQTLDPVRFPVKAGTSSRALPRESKR
jgi:hypothetical protein